MFARTGQQTADFLDVTRIEVLYGPQGSLFGKNASASVISITTRDPGTILEGLADAAYYQGNEFRIRAGVSGSLTPKLLGSLTGFYARYDGS